MGEYHRGMSIFSTIMETAIVGLLIGPVMAVLFIMLGWMTLASVFFMVAVGSIVLLLLLVMGDVIRMVWFDRA